MKKKTKILITIGVVLAILIIVACAGVFYFIGLESEQQAKLQEELQAIENYTQDGANINYDELQSVLERTVTKGKYEIIEKASKQYLTDVVNTQKEIMELLKDERFGTMLSIQNYKEDGPEFVKTKEFITTTKDAINKYKEELVRLLSEEAVMSYIKEKDLNEKYIEAYRQGVSGELEKQDVTKMLDESLGEVLKVLDTAEKIINLLVENKSSWAIQGENIAFYKQDLLDQYNAYTSELGN